LHAMQNEAAPREFHLNLMRAALGSLALLLSANIAAEDISPPAVLKPAAQEGMYSTYADDRSGASRTSIGDASAATLSAAELMPALVSALDQLSKYHRLVALPEVIEVSHQRIEELVCHAKCGALAAYRPGEGIYIDERLKPETDLFARSILLHELVHYAQEMSGEHGDMRPCERWYHREQEAYAIQKKFLFISGSPTRVGYSAAKSTCDD
jgi:hypothetical protein